MGFLKNILKTTQTTRKAAFKKAAIGSAIIAALTVNPLHALAHLPLSAVKNKYLCFENPALNIATDIGVCLGVDGVLHSICEGAQGGICDALGGDHYDGGGVESPDQDIDDGHEEQHEHENNSNHHEGCDHNHNNHDTASHIEEGHTEHDHTGHNHEQGHGIGVAAAASLGEEHQQVRGVLKKTRMKIKKRCGLNSE